MEYPEKIRAILQPPEARPMDAPARAKTVEFIDMDYAGLQVFFAEARGYLKQTAQEEIPEYTHTMLVRERGFLTDMNLSFHYGGTVRGLVADGKLVSVNTTRYSARKSKDAWGVYAFFFFAYTLPRYRFLGYATELNHLMEEKAREQGYSRMRSLIQSRGGFRLHRRFKHHMWGIAEQGELVVDTPLSDKVFPHTVPKRARAYTDRPTPLTDDELLPLLIDPRGPFVYTEAEARRVLAQPVTPPTSHWPAAPFTPQAAKLNPVNEIPAPAAKGVAS